MNELELLLGQVYSGNGNGSGTTNYNALSNKPQINGVTLSGNKTAADLNIDTYDDTKLSARVTANETAIANRYTKSETDVLLADKAAQNSVLALQNEAENLRLANEATEAELTQHKEDIAVDLGGIVERLDADEAAIAGKQDTLVSGTSIKTVNGNSLLGEGNIELGGTHFEVGVEKWYGTYTADGVTYQVYSKLLDIGALPSAAGVTQYPHGITGINQILQISGFTNDGFVMNASRQNVQDNISVYQAKKSGDIVVEVGKDRSSKTGFVMLIYAKNN